MSTTMRRHPRPHFILATVAGLLAIALFTAVLPRAEIGYADDSKVSFGSTPTSLPEGGAINIVVERIGDTPLDFQATLTFGGGTATLGEHYNIGVPGNQITVPFGAGVTSRSVQVTAPNDNEIATRTFQVLLSTTNGVEINPPNPLTITIVDNDTPQAPVVTSISPRSGPIAGGTSVTINGVGFTGTSCPSGVRFALVLSTSCTVHSDTLITAITPGVASAMDAPVTVTSPVGTSNETSDAIFSYSDGPRVTSISPTAGPAGTIVTIVGVGFTPSPVVRFGATQADIISATTNVITATAPVGAGSVHVTVTVSALISPETLDDIFTYSAIPTVTDVSPISGPPGTSVTITGTGFTANATVKFGTVDAQVTSVIGTTSIVAIVPTMGAGPVDISVTTINGTSLNTADDDFTVGVGVTVTSVQPNKGPLAGGTVVTVRGSGFTNVLSVKFGTVNGTNLNVVSTSELTVTSPARPEGGTVSVFVVTGAGANPDTANDDFTYVSVPIITQLSPNTGPVGQSTFVTITGQFFGGATKVQFGDTSATFSYNSDNEIIAITPSTIGAGAVDVRITTPLGMSLTGEETVFTFVGNGGLPTVSGLSPSSTPIDVANTQVVITGTNFSAPLAVYFGTVQVGDVQILSSSQLRVLAPARSTAGVVDVVVETTLGRSSTTGLGNDFTYAGPNTGLTTSYSLYFRWTFVTWNGKNNISVDAALRGQESPDNPNTQSVLSRVTAVFYQVTDGIGCPAGQTFCWLGYFPSGAGVPGANNLNSLITGRVYWVAVNQTTTWTVLQGP